MSGFVSNVRNTPPMVGIRRVRKPSEDRRSDGREPEPEPEPELEPEPEAERTESRVDDGETAGRATENDEPMLDEYV